MAKKTWRKLHFGEDEIWTYRITGSYVLVREPERKCHKVDLPTFLEQVGQPGWTWDLLERAEWKGYLPPIGPGDVKRYVEKNLRKEG